MTIVLFNLKPSLFSQCSGASYEASYETLFALVLFDSLLSDSRVIQN